MLLSEEIQLSEKCWWAQTYSILILQTLTWKCQKDAQRFWMIESEIEEGEEQESVFL